MHPPILLSLRITPLRFRLETLGPFRMPEYKGALFRGGFGQFFRDLVCITRAPVCTGCPHFASCSYSLVYAALGIRYVVVQPKNRLKDRTPVFESAKYLAYALP